MARASGQVTPFGAFLDSLRTRGLLDRSLLAFTADHGVAPLPERSRAQRWEPTVRGAARRDASTTLITVMAACATNEALLSGWRGMPIVEQFPLDEIASAHAVVESSRQRGRVVVML